MLPWVSEGQEFPNWFFGTRNGEHEKLKEKMRIVLIEPVTARVLIKMSKWEYEKLKEFYYSKNALCIGIYYFLPLYSCLSLFPIYLMYSSIFF